MTKDIQGEGLAWQVATWNQMANLYASENAPRLEPVAERVIFHADLNEGEAVLGTGIGLVPQLASVSVGLSDDVIDIYISPEILTIPTISDRSSWAFKYHL